MVKRFTIILNVMIPYRRAEQQVYLEVNGHIGKNIAGREGACLSGSLLTGLDTVEGNWCKSPRSVSQTVDNDRGRLREIP